MRILIFLITLALLQAPIFGASRRRTHHKRTYTAAKKRALSRKAARAAARKRLARAHRHHAPFVAGGPWKSPTFTSLPNTDRIDGDNLMVRRAAAGALGNYNGAVVVTDINTGRILSIVNQDLAYKGGFQPCSTIKLVTALAALSEGVIERDSFFRVSRVRWDLTRALARSNNGFFATLGVKLGFDKVSHYARLLGLGEKASLNIEAEQPGALPPVPPKNGGVGMMTSFGEGISLTPLELAAIVGAIGNGGTLYYLQYPRNQREVILFQPRIKRRLPIGAYTEDLKPGMRGAVEFGTARRASADQEESILGKTGTCTDYRAASHMGWFGSFNESGTKRIAVVVMLTGGRGVSGPVASGIAGEIYRTLSQEGYFGADTTSLTLVSTQSCCELPSPPVIQE